MFTKTLFALLTALVLTTSSMSAQAQTEGRGCVPANTEESVVGAYPAWNVS